jgi:ParB-like chromosome segregation protein Spo0J
LTPAVRFSPSALVGMVHVAAERKIGDEELARLRRLANDGWSHDDLAEAFGVSRLHVGRLVRGEQRPVIAAPDPETAQGDVSSAVAAFLEDVELNRGDDVLAATARALKAGRVRGVGFGYGGAGRAAARR